MTTAERSAIARTPLERRPIGGSTIEGSSIEIGDPKAARTFGHALLLARHRIAESGLFTDEALARLLDSHPRERLRVYTMGDDLVEQDWRSGDPGDYDGATLLEATRNGKLWFNVQRVGWHHPEYRALVDRLYDDLEAACPGLKTFRRSAHVLISSPGAQVFYHADAPLNILWHIRGRKRVWVYPNDQEPFINQEQLEQLFAPGEVGEELSYRPEFDEAAEVIDLEPGEFVTWPQNTPHRVANTEGLNVSLSTEHYTPDGRRRQAIVLANRFFRRHLPFAFRSMELYGPGPFVKANVFRVIRRLGLAERQDTPLPNTFRVDPTAPNAVRPLA